MLQPLLDHSRDLSVGLFADARGVLRELAERVHRRLRRRGFATFGALLRGARDLLRNAEVRAERARRASASSWSTSSRTPTTRAVRAPARARARRDRGRAPRSLRRRRPQAVDLRLAQRRPRRLRALRERSLAAGGARPARRQFPLGAGDPRRGRARGRAGHEPRARPPARFEPLVASEPTRAPSRASGARARAGRALAPGADPRGDRWLDADGTRDALAEREARAVARDLRSCERQGVSLDQVAILLRVTARLRAGLLEALRGRASPTWSSARRTSTSAARSSRRWRSCAACSIRTTISPGGDAALIGGGCARRRAPSPLAGGIRRSAPATSSADAARLEAARAAVRTAARSFHRMCRRPAQITGWPDALDRLPRTLHELRGPSRPMRPSASSSACASACCSRRARQPSPRRARVANLDRFFRDLVLALDEAAGSAASLVAVLRRAGSVARESQRGPTASGRWRRGAVLTIHRAKGLDWEHVYLLGTDRGHRGDDPKRTAVVRRGGATSASAFRRPSRACRSLEPSARTSRRPSACACSTSRRRARSSASWWARGGGLRGTGAAREASRTCWRRGAARRPIGLRPRAAGSGRRRRGRSALAPRRSPRGRDRRRAPGAPAASRRRTSGARACTPPRDRGARCGARGATLLHDRERRDLGPRSAGRAGRRRRRRGAVPAGPW